MPEESTTPDVVEMVRRGVEADNHREYDRVMTLYAPDVVWDGPTAGLRDTRIRRGQLRAVSRSPAGLRGDGGRTQVRTDMRGPWVEFAVQIERLKDLRDTLVALITFVAKGRDGIWVEQQWAHVVTCRRGVSTVTGN